MGFQPSAFQPTAFQVPIPTWVSPSDGSSVAFDTPLVFTSVSSAMNAHFNLQASTSPYFTDVADYRSDRGGFDYWDGSAWKMVPTGGMPSGVTGNNVRFTTALPIGETLYFRVRQSK